MHLKHCSEKGFVHVPTLPEESLSGGRKVKKPCLQAAWKALSVSLEGAPLSDLGNSCPQAWHWVRRLFWITGKSHGLWGHFWKLGYKNPNVVWSLFSLEWALSCFLEDEGWDRVPVLASRTVEARALWPMMAWKLVPKSCCAAYSPLPISPMFLLPS